MSHLYAVGAFGANDNHRLAGFIPSVRNIPYKLYLSDPFYRTVQLAGSEALYAVRVYIFTEPQLAEAKLKNAQVGLIHYNAAGNRR